MTEDDLPALYRLLREYGATIRALDQQLGPAYDCERAIKSALKRTHGTVADVYVPPDDTGKPRTYEPRRNDHDGRTVAVLDLSIAAQQERAPLFAELDRLCKYYGPIREQRRVAAIEMHATRKTVERLQKERDRKS